MVDLDITLFAQFAIVCLFVWLMSQLVFKPFLNLLETRDVSIAGAKQASQKTMQSIQAKEEELRVKLESIRKQSMMDRQKLIGQAREQERMLIDNTAQQAQKTMEQARIALAKNKAQVRQNLQAHTGALAQLMVRKILNTKQA